MQETGDPRHPSSLKFRKIQLADPPLFPPPPSHGPPSLSLFNDLSRLPAVAILESNSTIRSISARLLRQGSIAAIEMAGFHCVSACFPVIEMASFRSSLLRPGGRNGRVCQAQLTEYCPFREAKTANRCSLTAHRIPVLPQPRARRRRQLHQLKASIL